MKFVLPAVAAMLAGCYPMHVETYLPKATGGSAIGQRCNVVAGPDENWLFEVSGLEVEVALLESDGEARFTVLAKRGTAARFASSDLLWATSERGPWQPAPVSYWADPAGGPYTSRPGVMPVRQPLREGLEIAVEKPRFAGLLSAHPYNFTALLATPLPPVVYLKIPSLHQDGRDIDFPVLRFSKERVWYLYAVVLNC